MNHNFDSAPPAASPALLGLLIAAISGALVGACLMLLFVMPYILRAKEVITP